MKLLGSLLTILFVAGSVYYVAKVNDLPQLAEQYVKQYSSNAEQLQKELPDDLTNLTRTVSSGLPNVAPALEQALPVPSTAQVGLPQMLQQIETLVSPPQASTAGGSSSTAVSSASAASGTTAGALTRAGIIAETNFRRTQQSVKVLSESAQLDASAQAKAEDMLAGQYFAHTAPDGKTVSDLVAEQGYAYIKIGENLALGDFTGDSDVVTAWMNSPEHRANMLDPDFTDIGVGISYGMYQGHMAYLVVQHFGRPRSSCPKVDASLEAQVKNGQAELDSEVSAMNSLKTEIDQGRAQGQDMNAQADAYNADLQKYNTEFSQIQALSAEYNAEASAFNSCLSS